MDTEEQDDLDEELLAELSKLNEISEEDIEAEKQRILSNDGIYLEQVDFSDPLSLPDKDYLNGVEAVVDTLQGIF